MNKNVQEDPGPGQNLKAIIVKTINKLGRIYRDLGNNIKNNRIFYSRIHRNVFGYPKNVLDIKRPICKSGFLSIF